MYAGVDPLTKKRRYLAETVPAGIFQTDAQGQRIYVNPWLADITGDPSLADASGRPWVVHEADEDRVFAEFLREYWHKKPLLIRQALPGFQAFLPRDELFALAAQDDVVATRAFVRPLCRGGRLVLPVLPAGRGRLAPFEVPNPTPCCGGR